jgi:serine/threonine protein kinase
MNFCSYVQNDFLHDSAVLHDLGKGAYGMVKLVQRTDGDTYAVKYIPIETNPEGILASLSGTQKQYGITSSALWDIDALAKLRTSSFITQLVGICYQNYLIAIILEPMDSNLNTYIQRTSINLRIQEMPNLMLTLMKAAAIMETLNIIHFDMKPANVLVKKNAEPIITGNRTQFKVTDFGIARSSHKEYHVPMGEVFTLWYRPPEFLARRDRYTFNIHSGDIWSSALTILEYIIGNPIIVGKTPMEILRKIKNIYGTQLSIQDFFDANKEGSISGMIDVKMLLQARLDPVYLRLIDPAIITILSKMLSLNPDDRPSAYQILMAFNSPIDPQYILSLIPREYPRQIDPLGIELIINLTTRVSRATILIAIELFTRYLTEQTFTWNDIYSIALVALWDASKYNEDRPLQIKHMQRAYEQLGFSKIGLNEIIAAEGRLLEQIKFQVYNLNLTPVIRRVYTKKINLTEINPNIYAEPLDHWFTA